MAEKDTSEKVFYKDSTVIVTQSRYVTGNKTYIMRNISSVTISRITESRFGPKLITIIGILIIFISTNLQALGGLLIILGIIWYILIKDSFTVRISTNSGEVNSLRSKDKLYIEKIIKAINNAIIYRG